MVPPIGGNLRMASKKDMEHLSILVERDIQDNIMRVKKEVMEY